MNSQLACLVGALLLLLLLLVVPVLARCSLPLPPSQLKYRAVIARVTSRRRRRVLSREQYKSVALEQCNTPEGSTRIKYEIAITNIS